MAMPLYNLGCLGGKNETGMGIWKYMENVPRERVYIIEQNKCENGLYPPEASW